MTTQTLTEDQLTARLAAMSDEDLLVLWDEATEYAEETDDDNAWAAVARIERVVVARDLT